MGPRPATGPGGVVRRAANTGGRREGRYTAQRSARLGSEAAESRRGPLTAEPRGPARGRFSRTTTVRRFPAARLPADDQSPDATSRSLCYSQGLKSPCASGLVGHSRDILSSGIANGLPVFTPPPPCFRSGARTRACPAHAPPTPARVPFFGHAHCDHPRGRGPSQGPSRKPAQTVPGDETRRARESPSQFSFILPPPSALPPKKKASRDPNTQDTGGLPNWDRGVRVKFHPGNLLLLPTTFDSRPPPTLDTQ